MGEELESCLMGKGPGSAGLKQLNELMGAQMAKKPSLDPLVGIFTGVNLLLWEILEVIPVFLSPLQDEVSSMDFEPPAACACCL